MPSHSDDAEKTEFLYGVEVTTAATLRWLSKIEKRLDCVVESNAPSVVTEVEPFRNAYIFMKNKDGSGPWPDVSKAIVESHGGKIGAQNKKEGKGTTFAFTLPLAES